MENRENKGKKSSYRNQHRGRGKIYFQTKIYTPVLWICGLCIRGKTVPPTPPKMQFFSLPKYADLYSPCTLFAFCFSHFAFICLAFFPFSPSFSSRCFDMLAAANLLQVLHVLLSRLFISQNLK
jgi:hypothetical protein